MGPGPGRREKMYVKDASSRIKEHGGPLSVTKCVMAPEFCIASIFKASGQPPDPEPAILHANKDSLHVKLPP